MRSAGLASLFVLVFLLFLIPSPTACQELKVAREKKNVPESASSLLPPSGRDRIGVVPVHESKQLDLPSSFDWRDSGAVPPVKNQMPFGGCWAFSAVADLESKVVIREGVEFDFSELNLISCCENNTSGYSGGSGMIAANYFSVYGSVLETCDPWPGDLPYHDCVNPACTFYKRVTEWRMIPPDVTSIKNAIYNYGPVQAIAYTDNNWQVYTGDYCLWTVNSSPNHNVLLVGWSDTICDGGGGWIGRNHSGTAWGDSGFFYCKYNNASLESVVTVFTNYKDYDSCETLRYWDEHGWKNGTGFGDGDDFGLVEIAVDSEAWLSGVSFWATSSPTHSTLKIYDDFNGTAPYNLLRDEGYFRAPNAGFYTIPFARLLPLQAADPIYIRLRLNTVGYEYPIPFDDTGPMATGKSFVSDDGTAFEALDSAYHELGDIGIRARVVTCMDRGDPGFMVGFGAETENAAAGDTVQKLLSPANFGSTSSVCQENDSFCVHVTDTQGWNIWGSPPLESPIYLSLDSSMDQNVYVKVPDTLPDSTRDTLIAYISYWEGGACQEDHGDCEDPSLLGGPHYSADTLIVIASGCVGLPQGGALPKPFELDQNHPNPFNPYTQIEYNIARACHVSLVVFNIRGEKVATLVNEHQEAGPRSVSWDGLDNGGGRLASGVYLYRLKAGGFTSTRKMVIAR